MLVLGIETSCDETAISLVENGRRILSSVVASSLHLHREYGGVVPEIATRHHLESINYVLGECLRRAKKNLSDIGLIACVYGPGLKGALLIGLSLAKALSLSLGVDLVGINHIQAHLYAALIKKGSLPFPFVGLVVSGGHTNLFYVRDYLSWQILGATLDDAAGEAFDKVAKLLRLGYPGGPVIEQLARKNRARPGVRFPRAFLQKGSLDFSFSGLKTAVMYYIRDLPKPLKRRQKSAIAFGFQEAAAEMISERCLKACRLKKVKDFVVGGGVAANQRLKRLLSGRMQAEGFRVHFPSLKLCQDNAAMVAGLGYQLYKRGRHCGLDLEAEPNLKI